MKEFLFRLEGVAWATRQREVKKNSVHVSTSVTDRRMERMGEWSGGIEVEGQQCPPLCCFGQSIKTIPPLDKCEGVGQRKWTRGVQKGLTDPEGKEK